MRHLKFTVIQALQSIAYSFSNAAGSSLCKAMGIHYHVIISGGTAEWLRRSVSNHMRGLLVRVRIPSLEPLIISQQSSQLSVLPSSLNEYSRSNSDGTSTGHTLITANLKLKCFIRYKDSSVLLFIIVCLYV